MIKKLLTLAAFTFVFSTPANATCTLASYYALDGNRTANGEIFSSGRNTAAHPYLPFGTRIRVTNSRNGRSVVVRINDRGPYVASRGLDLSYGAFAKIASPSQGIASVCFTVL